jgi:glutamate racemase
MIDGAIGIFDSGIGGLTVAKEIKSLLPNEKIIYLGDTARLPFGTKSPNTIQRYTMQNADFLLKRGVKILVVACNTASAWALDNVIAESSVPVVGVIAPGCTAAVAASTNSKNNNIGVIGTSATIRSEAYPSGIHKLQPDLHVISRQCPMFVPLVEEGWIDTPITAMIIDEYLKEMKGNISTLVLGCTHYPLLKPAIQKYLGPDVEIICSSETTAAVVKEELGKLNLLRSKKSEQDSFFLTDHSATFQRVMHIFMDNEQLQVEQVDISSLSQDS